MYCYAFPDRDTFVAACETLGWVSTVYDEDGETVLYRTPLAHYTHDRAIDEIGPIQTVPGTYDADGAELTAPTYNYSHHVNFIGEAPEEWDEYLIVVNSPSRIFAGSPGPAPGDDVLEEIV